MKVAFFHGLDSEPISEKNYSLRIFDEVYDPKMDYRNDTDLFNNVLSHLKQNPVDLLIGSSMGGYFAYCLSTHLGVRTLLFNPAVHSRPIEPIVSMGDLKSNNLIVLGTEDTVIKPQPTVEFFKSVGDSTIMFENMGHLIPIDIFKKYISLYKI
jgi:esterase/lipase